MSSLWSIMQKQYTKRIVWLGFTLVFLSAKPVLLLISKLTVSRVLGCGSRLLCSHCRLQHSKIIVTQDG